MICFLFFCFLLTFKERVRLCRLHIRTDPDPFPYFPSQLNRYRRRKYNELPRCSYQNNFSSFQLFSTPAGRRYRITAVPVWYFHKKWWENKKPDSLTVWQSDLPTHPLHYYLIWLKDVCKRFNLQCISSSSVMLDIYRDRAYFLYNSTFRCWNEVQHKNSVLCIRDPSCVQPWVAPPLAPHNGLERGRETELNDWTNLEIK